LELEHGPHLAIPQGVGGDFFFTVAPYDPVFFLHHTQLDRIWWRWQQAHPEHSNAYSGPSSHDSNDAASMDDLLPYGELAKSLPVRDVMSTESDLLCYRY
jgi:tyrosinase